VNHDLNLTPSSRAWRLAGVVWALAAALASVLALVDGKDAAQRPAQQATPVVESKVPTPDPAHAGAMPCRQEGCAPREPRYAMVRTTSPREPARAVVPDRDAAIETMAALAQNDSREAGRLLAELAASSARPRLDIAFALVQGAPAALRQALAGWLRDPSYAKRKLAYELAVLDVALIDADVVAAARVSLNSESDPAAIAAGLGLLRAAVESGDMPAVLDDLQGLRPLLGHADAGVRRAAFSMVLAADRGAAATTERDVIAALSDASPDVRRAAMDATAESTFRSPAVKMLVMQLAQLEQDPHARQQAIETLRRWE
jgi:hypothetical protein